LNERLAEVVNETSSPDGGIVVTIRSADDVSIEFRDGAYRRHNEDSLANELQHVARKAWASWHKEFMEVVNDYGDPVWDDPSGPEDAELRRHMETMELQAQSSRGAVSVWTRAFLDWRIRIAPGSLQMPQQDFVAELADVLKQLRAQQTASVAEAKGRLWGYGWLGEA
jgi:hypothetical protein